MKILDRARHTRQTRLTAVAATCQVVTILVTWSLWNQRSSPPNLPLISALRPVPFALPLLLLAAIAIMKPRVAAPLFGVVYVLAALADQTRLQPEVISLAVLMIAPLYGGYGRSIARWHLTTMWLWAGAHKVLSLGWSTGGARFIADSLHVPGARVGVAVVLPLCEIGIGAASLSRRAWPLVRWAGLALHLGIFLTLSPPFANWNSSVWAWNIGLGIASVLLFSPRHDSVVPAGAWRVPIAVMAAYPALFYVGVVDAYLSHNLYSSNTADAFVCSASGCSGRLFDTWSALNVPLPPEPRLYRQLFDAVCVPDSTLVVIGPATRFTDPPSTHRHPCPRRASGDAGPDLTTTTTTSTTTTTASTTTSTSTTTTTVSPAVPSIAGKVIVLDPGHNEGNSRHTSEINQQVDIGNGSKACDTTGTATNDGYSEASYNTDIADRVAALLRADGATVVLTRDASTPWGPCITERAAIGNHAHADAAISIHADGGPADGRGFHVIEPLLVAGHNDGIIEPSKQLALMVRDAYRSVTGLPFSTYLGHDGIDARNDLGGLNLSTVPKVFIETGNMRNATDARAPEGPCGSSEDRGRNRQRAHRLRERKVATPSPSRSSSATSRPDNARISASDGPRTNCPSVPLFQSMSVASSRSPARRPLATKPWALLLARKSRIASARLPGTTAGNPSGRRMSAEWIVMSLSGASGPAPGGLNFLSALARSAAINSAGDFSSAILRESLSLALSKLKPLPAIDNMSFGIGVVSGITRCPTTCLTVHLSHRLGVFHALSSSVSS